MADQRGSTGRVGLSPGRLRRRRQLAASGQRPGEMSYRAELWRALVETGRPWSFATTEQPDLLIAAGADSRSDQGCAWTHDRLPAMAVDDPWTAPSKLATSILLTVALAALGLTSWYVWSGFPYTFIGLAMAGLLLGGPLVTRWPITPRRAGFSAAAWFVVGVPGSYMFGIPVILTSLVLALGVAGIVLRALLVRERSVPG